MKLNGYQLVSEIINEARLPNRLMKLSDKALARISPEASAARKSGKVPIYLTGEGGKAFGFKVPRGTGGMQPTMKQHVVDTVRETNRPKHVWNKVLQIWEKPKQGDLLAQKKPGEVLKRHLKRKDSSNYW